MAVIIDYPLWETQGVYQLCSFPINCSKLLWVTFTQKHITLHSLISSFLRSISKFRKTSRRRTNNLRSSKVWTTYFVQLSCFLYILVCVFIQYSLAWNPTSYQFWFSTREMFSIGTFKFLDNMPRRFANREISVPGASSQRCFCTIVVCQSVFLRVLFQVTL